MNASLAAYPHRRAGHCASGAFRDLFEHRGLHDGAPLSEAMVFGLGAGLDLMLMPQQPGSRVPFHLAGRNALLEESLLARVGGTLHRRAESDAEAAWDFVRARLDRGEPVAMVADCQQLDYLRTRTSMPLHVIVAVGYDATHVQLVDNDRDTAQSCTHASLARARAARGFPLPAMHVTFEIDWPTRLPPIESLIGPAIAEVVANMRAPHGVPSELYGAEAFGLGAIDRLTALAGSLSRTPDLDTAMRAATLWISIEKAGTGGGLFRGLWRDFLGEAVARLPRDEALRAAHAHYAHLADAWSELGIRCATGWRADVPAALSRLAVAEREGHALLARVRD